MLDIGYRFKTDNREYTILELIGRGANTIAYLAERSCDGLVSKCILKEYAPQNQDDYANGKDRFIASGRMQNNIRQLSALNNQTSPVSFIFEYSGIPFIDVSCYGGSTLSRLDNLTLKQYMEICLTIARTIGYYHKSGYLCLDVKPENIFILQNTPDDTITQLIEFIDFDSIRKISEVNHDTVISCTKGWAAPEQLNPQAISTVGPQADIYTIGELVFFGLFGRHSSDKDHRGFSKYPFSESKQEYRKYTDRPDIQSLLTRLFRGTIRSSASNRFTDMTPVSSILEELVAAISKKEYIVPKFPPVSPNFTGRDDELKAIAANLKENHVLFLSGIGGIGKSTLIRNFITLSKPDYDILIYIEYNGDFRLSFNDDNQLQISTIHQTKSEDSDEYFFRKLNALRDICTDKKVLFIIDNYTGMISKDLSLIFDCGYDTVVVTRNDPPKNSFNVLKLEAISDPAKLFNLITVNLERSMTKEEKTSFEEIINLVHGHTLTLELIARQIAKGRINIGQALELMRENGFTHISDEKIRNYKDGEEVYDTLRNIITSLFDAGNMAPDRRFMLKVLSLFDVRGMDREMIRNILKFDMDTIHQLSSEGWIYDGSVIRLHPVISETVRNWSWDDIPVGDTGSLSDFCTMNDGTALPYDITVMKYHKEVCDIYVSCDNEFQLKVIGKEAENYTRIHPRHIIKALYHDIMGTYYDTCSHGIYVPYTKEEAEPLEHCLEEADLAIEEMEQSSDKLSRKYLPKLYMDLAMILIRSTPDGGEEAADLLNRVYDMLEESDPEDSDDRCYHNMITAWYYTLIEPDMNEMFYFARRAADIAFKVFPTDVEVIDIIYIPTANCLFFHNDMKNAGKMLEYAIEICRNHPDELRYIDKLIDLKIFQLDVFIELNDTDKCRELIDEIGRMNEAYRDLGIFREISQDTKDRLSVMLDKAN